MGANNREKEISCHGSSLESEHTLSNCNGKLLMASCTFKLLLKDEKQFTKF